MTRSTAFGFTLIEILVVLVVVSIVLAVALLSFGDFGMSRQQQLSLLQLKASMKSAQLEAVLKPMVLGLSITDTGYRYYTYETSADNTQDSWVTLSHDHLSDTHTFNTGTTVLLNTRTSAEKNQPRIYFLPDGSITPFKLTVIFSNHQRFTLFLNNRGEVILEKI